MSEAYDYDPGDWKGHDFGAARAAYNRHVGSSYADATAKKVSAKSLIEDKLTSTAQRPLIVVIDETGSMGDWPTTMFSKLPFLDHEVRYYLGDDAEVSFMAIGDAHCYENYALQVQPFASGTGLAESLKKLVIEGGGGGNGGETYELAALYLVHNLVVDPAAQPVVIFVGDEPCLPEISVEDAKKWSQVSLERRVSTAEVFKQLREKSSVYFIQKPYGSRTFADDGSMDSGSKRTHDCWEKLVGDDHIARLADPNRVADVIFGLLAAEVDRVDDFQKEIEDRQTKKQVDVVYKSLATVHAIAPKPRKEIGSGKSQVFVASDADDAPPLFGN
jgi:hypothetical protein